MSIELEGIAARFLGREDWDDLRAGKEYPVVEPEQNDPPEDIRIVDESGDDYLYPRHWFELKTRKA